MASASVAQTRAASKNRLPKVGEPLPDNCVWLPTAAKRRVENNRYSAQRAAVVEFRQDCRFTERYQSPWVRAAQAERELYKQAGVSRTPEFLLLMCMFANMPNDMREKVCLTAEALALGIREPVTEAVSYILNRQTGRKGWAAALEAMGRLS